MSKPPESFTPLPYIDEIACQIMREAGHADLDWLDLFRIYAVLALAKGEATTAEDVHDAWSAFMMPRAPSHVSLVPFDQLRPETQALDEPYVQAIHAVARTIQKEATV